MRRPRRGAIDAVAANWTIGSEEDGCALYRLTPGGSRVRDLLLGGPGVVRRRFYLPGEPGRGLNDGLIPSRVSRADVSGIQATSS